MLFLRYGAFGTMLIAVLMALGDATLFGVFLALVFFALWLAFVLIVLRGANSRAEARQNWRDFRHRHRRAITRFRRSTWRILRFNARILGVRRRPPGNGDQHH